MRTNTFAGQVIAALSRRASAFELNSAEPQTFPGRLRILLSFRRTDAASRTWTNPGQQKVIRKVFVALLVGVLVYFIINLTGQPQIWAWTVLISAIFALIVQLMRDLENRLKDIEKERSAESAETRLLIKEWSVQANEATELFRAVEASALRTDVVAELVRQSAQIGYGAPPLVYGFAQSQISRMSQFLKELGEGKEVSYDGGRDWILGLTTQCQSTIDATSLSTVDAGDAFEGGLWTSDLGMRYLELQRDAVLRGVVIRRIFILDGPGQAQDAGFLRIYQSQQNLGIRIRVLDRSMIPSPLKRLLFDFVVFDGAVSCEVTPNSSLGERRPVIVKTNLVFQAERVKERIRRFEDLWSSAQEIEISRSSAVADEADPPSTKLIE